MLNDHVIDGPENNDPKSWIDWTVSQQTRASDPQGSAWVSANAGSGKTHVLTQRVIRLLLAGCRPSAVLCLTYTKAAASEMSSRVFDRLAEWATMPDDELKDRIAAIEGATPDRIKIAQARRLFARALETPGGLKIQTIHAFCEALLHQFPLEANVAGHFSVLDDRAAAALLAEARRTLLTAVSMEESPDLSQALAYVLDIGDETGLEALLSAIVSSRTSIRAFLQTAEEEGGIDRSLLQRFGLEEGETEETAAGAFWPLPGLSGLALDTYLALSDQIGGARSADVSYALRGARHETDVFKRMDFVEAAMLTEKGTPKSDAYVINKAMLKAAPELADALTLARDHVATCRDRYRLVRMVDATRAALVLAERLINDFEDLKKQRSQLDFEDLIERAANLLNRDTAGAWVHYKLDQGIDHILVDEAQDTSPLQWSIIQSLAADFFSGTSARDLRRTLFAVGDEKQSIYSFQGARPERFSQEQSETKRRVTAVDQIFHSVRLPLSFRSTEDVLAAVDQVFSTPENAQGLSYQQEPVEHRSNRSGQPGTVELWDMIVPEQVEAEEDWTAPFDSLPESAPPAVMARRIAARIGEMIGKETLVEKGKERLIEAGDILVLVRKRHAFVNALTRELKKRRDIPVAGADRLRLTDHIAIQDLLALGRFVLLPQDDLSLSALLKSPLFNRSEDDVFEIAGQRGENESVWQHLQRLASAEESRFVETAERLQTFIELSRTATVHDFFAGVLTLHEGRKQFLARLGHEASDVLDEFLSFALDHERTGLPGLQSFISVLETDSPEVKREQDKDRGEVRIMTVHASKGLEAPVVFLVDGGSKAFNHSHLPKLRFIEATGGSFPVWLPGKGFGNSLVTADEARLKLSAEEEYRRLLYVAMTRAADHLIVCGYRGPRENPECWHAMVAQSLGTHESFSKSHVFAAGGEEWNGLLWHSQSRDSSKPILQDPAVKPTSETSLPPQLMVPLPPQPYLPRPLSPSGAGTIIDDGAEDLVVTSPLFSETTTASNIALQRGRLVHRMLQVLPDYPVEERPSAARLYVERAARFWSSTEREKLIATTLEVLATQELAAAFSSNSRAEVSIMGTLSLDGREYAVSGRIDRLAVDGDRVILVDYKTNRVPPQNSAQTPLAHKAQLAIYRAILAPLYPGKSFTCALVYTESAQLITLNEEELSQALAAIKTK